MTTSQEHAATASASRSAKGRSSQEACDLARAAAEERRYGADERRAEADPVQAYSESADAMIVVDATHKITACNDVARGMFGYSAQEILGANLDMLLPQRFRERHRQHVAHFAEGQSTARHMARRRANVYGRRKNGEEFATDAAISKLDIDGNSLLAVCLRDISGERRSEDELQLLAEIGEILVRAGSDYYRLITDVADAVVRNIAEWCAIEIVQADAASCMRVVHSDPAERSRCRDFERQHGHKGGAIILRMRRRTGRCSSTTQLGVS